MTSFCQTASSRGRKAAASFSLFILAFGLFCLLPRATLADYERDDLRYDIELLDALEEAGLVNYALLHIELMLDRYPDDEDHIRYAEARFHFARGRSREAREALEQIPSDSPFYTESLLLNAQRSVQRGDLEAASQAYEDYFSQVEEPASPAEADVRTFREAVLYYAQTKIEAGEPREAAEILELLGNLPEDQRPQEDSILLTVAEAVFEASENRLEADRSIDRELLEEYIEELMEVQWRHSGRSRLTVQAFIQAARGRILLEQPDQAMEALKPVGETAPQLEDQFPEEPSLVPAAYYYYARAFEEMGNQHLEDGNQQEAQRAMLRAATFYNRRLLENYPDHSYADRAIRRYARLEEVVEENFDGRLPSLPTGAAGELARKMQRADRYYQAGQYEQAIPLYQEIVDQDPEYRNLPEIGQKLVDSYLRQDNLSDARRVVELLAENFSEAEGTGAAMLLTGRAHLQKGQEAKDEEERNRLLGEAVEIWNDFVENHPRHRNAVTVAFFIAEHHYSQAVSLVRRAREADDPQVQSGLREMALEAFRQCVPYYRRMLDRYADTPEGVRSIYKLGWVYYNLDKGPLAADMFSRYSRLETARRHSTDRLRAKLHAGEQLMLSDVPSRGIDELSELLSWFESPPSGLRVDTGAAYDIEVTAANYLAWAYDREAETVRPALRDIDGQITAYEQAVREAEGRLEAVEVYEAQMQTQKEEAEESWEEINQEILAELDDPLQMARDEVMPSEEELADVSEDDRRRMLAAARRQADRLAEDYRESMIADRQGQIEDLRERRRSNREKLGDIEERISNTEEEIEQADDEAYIQRLEQELMLRRGEKEVIEHSLDADGVAISLLEIELAALQAENEEERQEILLERDYEQQREEVRKVNKTLRDKRIAQAEKELAVAEEQAEAARGEIDELKQKIEELEKERQPIFARLKEKKEEALEKFAWFIEEYPDSDYVPDHLARIGTINLEIENYDQAVEYLDRLASEYPDHEATMNAIFDLGRAQFETGDDEAAVETFAQIADQFSDQRASNLEYIARRTLDAGAADLSVKAYEELLERAQNPQHPDYARLLGEQGRYRERLLYRASEAALKAENFEAAVEFGEELMAANPRSAYLYDVQMNIGFAAREASPPDFLRARRAFGEVARMAQDEKQRNKALLEFGNTAMMDEERGGARVRQALGQYSQIVMVDEEEVIILADVDDPEVEPFVEEALYRSAECHALLGNHNRRDLLADEYRRRFPEGEFLARINNLPSARYD